MAAKPLLKSLHPFDRCATTCLVRLADVDVEALSIFTTELPLTPNANIFGLFSTDTVLSARCLAGLLQNCLTAFVILTD
jgi:hypothetical protein